MTNATSEVRVPATDYGRLAMRIDAPIETNDPKYIQAIADTIQKAAKETVQGSIVFTRTDCPYANGKFGMRADFPVEIVSPEVLQAVADLMKNAVEEAVPGSIVFTRTEFE